MCWSVVGETFRRYGETWRSVLWRSHVGDMEKRDGVVMAISYWSSLRSILELSDRKWRLNRNGEKMETNYGDQNFTHHGVENTYLDRFNDRNV